MGKRTGRREARAGHVARPALTVLADEYPLCPRCGGEGDEWSGCGACGARALTCWGGADEHQAVTWDRASAVDGDACPRCESRL
jgi:DNA-directed RNA polymerase subunit RPC12/RpoP